MYLAADAGRLAGVDGDRIGQWARWGHIRASVSDGDPHVYSFADVADALAVRILLDAGVTLPTIRRAVEALAGEHPLAGGIHIVDGRLAVERAGGLEDVFSEQRVLALNGQLDAEALLRAGGWPSLMTGVAVEVDPARAGGVPCVPGSRRPVSDALDEDDYARWWACGGPGVPRRDTASRPVVGRRAGPPGGLLLDGGLPADLAAELRARGRDAVHVSEIGLEHAADADVLASARSDGVLVTTAPIPGAIVVSGNVRDVVHRHAHEFATRRR